MIVHILLYKGILDCSIAYGAMKVLKKGAYIYLFNREWSCFLAVSV